MFQRAIILGLILIFSNIGIALSGTINLPQTGQTTCCDPGGIIIPCVGTGQDGDIRAGVAWPEPRFTLTYCDANGPCANQASDCDGNASTDMVTDNLTGLIWARNTNLTPRNWYGALNYVAVINSGSGLCGHHDWHLPNVNELESLVHVGHPAGSATWLNAQGFYNMQSHYYWSSTSYASSPGYAWIVFMDDDNVVAT